MAVGDDSVGRNNSIQTVERTNFFFFVLYFPSWFQVSAVERSPLVEEVHPLSQPIKRQGRKKVGFIHLILCM